MQNDFLSGVMLSRQREELFYELNRCIPSLAALVSGPGDLDVLGPDVRHVLVADLHEKKKPSPRPMIISSPFKENRRAQNSSKVDFLYPPDEEISMRMHHAPDYIRGQLAEGSLASWQAAACQT